MKQILKAVSLVALLLLVGCATQKNRDSVKNLQTYVKTGQFDLALKLVKSDDFYPEERSKLLKLLEVGTVHYLNQNYFQSLKAFDEAQELSDQLFTESIKGKVASAVINANMDKYYGEKYERSLIRFYQALSNFMLYQTGKYEAYVHEEKQEGKKELLKKDIPAKVLSDSERKTHLAAARANILNWDSLLESYRNVTQGKPVYKDDLIAKVFGAFIHEQMSTRSDLQIAEKLYESAKTTLLRNFGLYSSYNYKAKDFKGDFSKFGELGEAVVEQKYLTPTEQYKNLLGFIDGRLQKLKSGKKDNVFIFMQAGFIEEKTAKKIEFPLPQASFPPAMGGDFVSFCTNVLTTAAGVPTISFEVPQVLPLTKNYRYEVVVTDKAGKEVHREKMGPIGPLSDIAFDTLDDKIISTYAATGTRMAVKHIAALLAAYQIKKSSKMGGMALASLSYAAANKGIAASEQADVRYWGTLPHDVNALSFSLPKGEYKVEVQYQNLLKLEEKGSFQVKSPLVVTDASQLVDLRTY